MHPIRPSPHFVPGRGCGCAPWLFGPKVGMSYCDIDNGQSNTVVVGDIACQKGCVSILGKGHNSAGVCVRDVS